MEHRLLVRRRLGVLPHEEIRAGACRVLPKATGEVLCTGHVGKDFEFRMDGGGMSIVTVSYSAKQHAFLAGGKEIALEVGDAPTVHALWMSLWSR
jgi:beta-fructofuranosidase